ncbi:MAG TPA: TIGR00730 family Rossman fold protein [Chitinophagaceae bacterium]|nr:TIGR00730 family Rossman fold protein [Chitinophagaceae bacterium]
MPIQSLAVFCGSKSGSNSVFTQHAGELGKLLAQHQITLVYGGGGKGIMKVIADNVMKDGGKVIGVIPKILIDWEYQHKNITQLIVTEDMHSRKKTIYSLCDAALVLPGGFGTLDELFEMLTWNQLSIHDKRIFILNSGGYYDHLIRHLQMLEENNFLYEPLESRVKLLNEPGQLVSYLQ